MVTDVVTVRAGHDREGARRTAARADDRRRSRRRRRRASSSASSPRATSWRSTPTSTSRTTSSSSTASSTSRARRSSRSASRRRSRRRWRDIMTDEVLTVQPGRPGAQGGDPHVGAQIDRVPVGEGRPARRHRRRGTTSSRCSGSEVGRGERRRRTCCAGRERALAEVDLGAIRHNVRRLMRDLPPGAVHCAVVKANGYGHGAVPAARAALEAGLDVAGRGDGDRGRGAARRGARRCPCMIFGPMTGAELAARGARRRRRGRLVGAVRARRATASAPAATSSSTPAWAGWE